MRDFIDYLEGLEIRPLDEQFLREFWPTVTEIIRNPTSNPPAAVVIYLIIVTFVLIVGMAILLFVMRPRDEDEDEFEYVVVGAAGAEPVTVRTASETVPATDPSRVHRTFLGLTAVGLALLVVSGMSSQGRTVCLSCHEGIAHTADVAGDAHRDVRCIECHEPGGAVRSVTIGVPARLAHIVQGGFSAESGGGYGPVVGTACLGCHDSVTREITYNSERALRMSHSEPLEAGAKCMACHMLGDDSKIGRATVGMAPCLRCHNDVDASVACATCHTSDVSNAVLAARTHEPRQVIAQPDCYTCHDSAPCDACHGVRLPHSLDYRWSHMYDAASDLWFNGGGTCGTCHTETRRSCYSAGCHLGTTMPYHLPQDPTFPRRHAEHVDWGNCADCHEFAAQLDDPCLMCHTP